MNPKNRTPRQILTASIKDIEHGLWVCNSYAETNYEPKAKKPLGCAIGLVAINAGVASVITNRDGSVSASVPTNMASYTKQAKKVVALLAKTAKLSKYQRTELREDVKYALLEGGNADELYASAVIGYNDEGGADDGNLKPRQALAWFNRALKALDK